MTQQNPAAGSSMQQYLDITEIKDGVVVVRDGSLRVVLAASSLNFDLKADKEQEAIIFGFQQFLNSLDFPLQIMVSSRRYNVTPYLEMLMKRRAREKNELLRNQIGDYCAFVRELVSVSDIMSKAFYIVVPFYRIESKKEGIFDKLSSAVNPRREIYQEREKFETYKTQLFQRVMQVREGLSGFGVRAVPLNTQELIELYYNFYNPSEFEYVNISDIDEVNVQLQN